MDSEIGLQLFISPRYRMVSLTKFESKEWKDVEDNFEWR